MGTIIAVIAGGVTVCTIVAGGLVVFGFKCIGSWVDVFSFGKKKK